MSPSLLVVKKLDLHSGYFLQWHSFVFNHLHSLHRSILSSYYFLWQISNIQSKYIIRRAQFSREFWSS